MNTFNSVRFCILSCTLFFSTLALANTNSTTTTNSTTKTTDASSLKSSAQTSPNDPEQNLNKSLAFLAENKKKSGIVTLPSGLQYKIIREGQGKSPGPEDFVTVHYRGTLINGTEFESSYSDKEPATFAVNSVIPGWSEALQLMNPGAKWMIYLPPVLAYGKRGAGNKIAPNSALIFEIELIAIKPSFDEDPEAHRNEWEDSD